MRLFYGAVCLKVGGVTKVLIHADAAESEASFIDDAERAALAAYPTGVVLARGAAVVDDETVLRVRAMLAERGSGYASLSVSDALPLVAG